MRYLQVTVNLQTRSQESATLMDENAPLIQGEILMLMQALDFGVVRTVEGKQAFIAQIDESIRVLFDSMSMDGFELERVVLTGFVVQ
jgi:flagellar basal body-associated protein FliL